MSKPPKGSQLWAKGLQLDAAIHRFTVGSDPETDLGLVPFDALGSAAHALTLLHGNFLTRADASALIKALHRIEADAQHGEFIIRPEQEDGHTAIEATLVTAVGDAGKRIHLGRSRNDQVILATRLYLREMLIELGQKTAALAQAFLSFARKHEKVPMPGYTHLRRAMPSSLAQWSSAFAESLLEELEALRGVYTRLDRCPAGAAAGFGAPVPLERRYTARLLGFKRVQRNPVDVQNSRGRHELVVLHWLSGIANVLEKFLWDLSLYTSEEFGFLKLPDAFTTGSSIMPQKRNPDVVELARASCRELRGRTSLVEQLTTGLPSNYHRDLQLLKAPLMQALARGEELFSILARLVSACEPVPAKLKAAYSPELWAAHEASRRVSEGLTFRDAYQQVGKELLEGTFSPRAEHTFDFINDARDEIATELGEHRAWLDDRDAWHARHRTTIWNFFEETEQ